MSKMLKYFNKKTREKIISYRIIDRMQQNKRENNYDFEKEII
jgi:hypothetical protein